MTPAIGLNFRQLPLATSKRAKSYTGSAIEISHQLGAFALWAGDYLLADLGKMFNRDHINAVPLSGAARWTLTSRDTTLRI